MKKVKKDIYLTKEGLKELQDELDTLIKVQRPEVIEALKAARELGDLSENADYDAARDLQAKIEARIKDLEVMIDNSSIIEKNNNSKIGMGSCVEIEYVEDGEREKYNIVGSQEADPFENKISNESKLAEAIMGKQKGDKVSVTSPAGNYEVLIIEVC